MIIYPAMDLKDGKCVRLYQGDYSQETIYSSDPLAVAEQFIDEGATWLHIVDLDGAKNPKNIQLDLIYKLIKTCKVNIQIGGGIRENDQIRNLLELGVARVVIGSAAITKSDEVIHWLNSFGSECLCLAFDVKINKEKKPFVATHAWNEISSFLIDDLIELYKPSGLKHVLCTNILLDGTLKGPDFHLYQTLVTKFPILNIQASAGIQTLTDIKKLKEIGVGGAIIGRALYENMLTLREAIQCSQNELYLA